jgi:hypothetical protein
MSDALSCGSVIVGIKSINHMFNETMLLNWTCNSLSIDQSLSLVRLNAQDKTSVRVIIITFDRGACESNRQ